MSKWIELRYAVLEWLGAQAVTKQACVLSSHVADGAQINCEFLRIFAIGDLHGDAELLWELLTTVIGVLEWRTGALVWSSSFANSALVCLGDFWGRERVEQAPEHWVGVQWAPSDESADEWKEERLFIVLLLRYVASEALKHKCELFLIAGHEEADRLLGLERRQRLGSTQPLNQTQQAWFIRLGRCMWPYLRLNNVAFMHADPAPRMTETAMRQHWKALGKLARTREAKQAATAAYTSGPWRTSRLATVSGSSPPSLDLPTVQVDRYVMGHTPYFAALRDRVVLFDQLISADEARAYFAPRGEEVSEKIKPSGGVWGALLDDEKRLPKMLFADAGMSRAFDEWAPRYLRRPQCLLLLRDEYDNFDCCFAVRSVWPLGLESPPVSRG